MRRASASRLLREFGMKKMTGRVSSVLRLCGVLVGLELLAGPGAMESRATPLTLDPRPGRAPALDLRLRLSGFNEGPRALFTVGRGSAESDVLDADRFFDEEAAGLPGRPRAFRIELGFELPPNRTASPNKGGFLAGPRGTTPSNTVSVDPSSWELVAEILAALGPTMPVRPSVEMTTLSAQGSPPFPASDSDSQGFAAAVLQPSRPTKPLDDTQLRSAPSDDPAPASSQPDPPDRRLAPARSYGSGAPSAKVALQSRLTPKDPPTRAPQSTSRRTRPRVAPGRTAGEAKYDPPRVTSSAFDAPSRDGAEGETGDLVIGLHEEVLTETGVAWNPVRVQSVVNEGRWRIEGQGTRVVVEERVLNRGSILVSSQASFTKQDFAVVNDGTIVVDGGSTFRDKSIINAARDDAWFYVSEQSSVVAANEFVAGDGSSFTGWVEISEDSRLSAGLAVLGKFGTGILHAADSQLDVSSSLILGNREGSRGELYLDASDLDVRGAMILGENNNSSAVVEMVGGSTLSADSISMSKLGSAILEANDAVIDVRRDLVVGSRNGSRAEFSMANTTLTVGGDLLVAEHNGSQGILNAGSGSLVTVQGDALLGGHADAHAAVTISGGASLETSADLAINAASSVTVEQGGLHVAGETEVIGALTLEDADVAFDESVEILGSLTSAGSLVDFGEILTLASGATVRGGPGDLYRLGGDFENNLEVATDLDLSGVTVELYGSPGQGHRLDIAGEDIGSTPDGLTGNYGLYGLVLGPGQEVEIRDRTSGGNGALYLEALVLADGLGQLAGVSGDRITVYYDAENPVNAYLNRAVYAFGRDGNGALVPYFIPEPGSVCLFLIGLALLPRRAVRRFVLERP